MPASRTPSTNNVAGGKYPLTVTSKSIGRPGEEPPEGELSARVSWCIHRTILAAAARGPSLAGVTGSGVRSLIPSDLVAYTRGEQSRPPAGEQDELDPDEQLTN